MNNGEEGQQKGIIHNPHAQKRQSGNQKLENKRETEKPEKIIISQNINTD